MCLCILASAAYDVASEENTSSGMCIWFLCWCHLAALPLEGNQNDFLIYLFIFFTSERWKMVVVVIGEVSQLACGHFLNESSDTPHWWFSPLQQDLCHYCDQNQSISQSLCLPLSASRSNAAESILTPLCENEGWVSLLRLESVSWMQCGLYLRIYICIFNSCAQSCARISVQVWKLLAHLCSLCHAHRAWFQNSIQPCTPLC